MNPSFPFGYSPKLLESILNVGTDYICVKDPEGYYVYVNKFHASLYNATPEEMIGKTAEPWVGKVQFDKWTEEDLAIIKSGHSKNFEPYARTVKDGTIRWFDSMKIPFTDEQRKQDLLLVIHRDITEIKEAEVERHLLRDKMMASQKMETLGLLAASVAHDFNNMLTIILASSTLITNKLHLDPEALFLSKSIAKAAERAGDVVSRLLILSRRESVEHYHLDLKQYLEETQSMMRAALGETIQVTFDLCPEGLPIKGNGTMVEQVLINLILNARDALPKGGAILVKASITKDPDGSEFVTLEVKDNGIGMSPETLKKAFDPFYTTKSVGQGSGLGLAVVQRVMEQHQGKIEVESQLNVGTHFILKFPKAHGMESASPAPVAATKTNLVGKTLLLVEDEDVVRELIVIILHSMEIKVLQATNGDEAWRIFQESGAGIDGVLTDVVMHGELDGVSLQKKIAMHSPTTPVIFMTGYSFDYFQDHGSMPENADILHKPFLPEVLRDKLMKLLS